MTEDTSDRFTVYLEGQDGRRGNVLLRSFLAKVHRLELVLGKLERAYLAADKRQTDFEIIGAEKVNPTSLTLLAVPHVRSAYIPAAALQWGMKQIRTVGEGKEPDSRVTLDIADDLANLADHDSPTGYKSFWVNGYAEKVKFDDAYHANALRLVIERRKQEHPGVTWREGTAFGSIVGELKKLDDFEHDREFVIVPPVGAPVVCTFPDSMLGEMGQYWSKIVRVSGVLSYKASSPFPESVEVREGALSFTERLPKRTLAQLRGVFEGRERISPDWGSLLHG